MTLGALDNLNAPAGWVWQSLWSIAPRIKECGRADLPPLSVFLEAGVVPRDSRSDNHNQLGEDLTRYLVAAPGDLVFNKLRTWQGGLGVSQYEGIVSPAYFVCRPLDEVEPRYLHYLLRSAPYLSELTRISKWMPPSQFDTPWENLRQLPILLPPATEQRRIADFLDAETSRIDRITALQRKVSEKLTARENAFRDSVVDNLVSTNGTLPFRRFLRGIEQGSSPQCDSRPKDSPTDWGVLKLSAVKSGSFNPEENKLLSDSPEAFSNNEVKEGDLLVTRANTPSLVGDAAVVNGDHRRLLLPDLIYRVLLDGQLLPEYACQIILSGRTRSLIEATARGSSQSMVKLRGEDIRTWPIPIASKAEQSALVSKVTKSSYAIRQVQSRIATQLDLIAERRQSLITAAVTGRLDVSSASGRGVGVLWKLQILSIRGFSLRMSGSRTSLRSANARLSWGG
jgi:type I restriction enzyme, S subunit